MAVSRLLMGSSLSGQILVRVGADPVIQHYEDVQAMLAAHAPRAADLFAQPVLDSRDGASPTRVSWYGAASQDPVTFARLPPSQRALAVAALRDRFAALAPLFTDPGYAPLLRAALSLPDQDGILWSGDAPVLVNWGIVPQALGATPENLARQFTAVFGDYALPGTTPWASSQPSHAAPLPPGTQAPAFVAYPAGTNASPHPPLPASAFSGGAGTERPAGTVGAILAAAAIVLLVAGVSLAAGYEYGWRHLAGLVMASAPAPGAATLDPDMRRIQESVNDGLRRRLADLQASAKTNICAAASEASSNGATPGTSQVLPPAAGLEPSPQQLQAQPQAGQRTQPADLADVLENSVVMVIGELTLPDGKQGLSLGSGFAIAPDTIVTNLHVVNEVPAGHLYVVSRKLAHLVPVSVVARTPNSDFGQADFALLKLPEGSLAPLALSNSVDRLLPVVAVGFPGFVTDAGDDFQHLLNGDSDAVPGAHFTEGIVSDLQTFQGQQVVIHTAAINKGNSGGPLADRCGRVVGINTFMRTDQAGAYSVDYALPAKPLLTFLSRNNIASQSDNTPCHPETMAPPQAGVSQASGGQAATPPPAGH